MSYEALDAIADLGSDTVPFEKIPRSATMAKKIKGLAEHQAAVVDGAPQDLNYIVPTLVGDWGAYVEVQANAIATEMSPGHILEAQQSVYRELADGVARLLEVVGVTKISDEAKAAATSRIAQTIPGALAVSRRVERLYRAYYLEETDHVRYEAERLWATLEARSPDLAGCPFQEVLAL